MRLLRARILLSTLWAGSLWTVGYLVAPTLFTVLEDNAMAGMLAGKLFRIEAWLSLVCGFALLILVWKSSAEFDAKRRKILAMLIGAMLACTLVGYFGLQPSMAALRESGQIAGAMTEEARASFGKLHGIASALYMLQSLLAVPLLFKLHEPKPGPVTAAG